MHANVISGPSGMGKAAHRIRSPGEHGLLSANLDVPESLGTQLSAALFSSLPRSDQRRKAEQYLRGLLSVDGRKSIRNIATLAEEDGVAPYQGLHHFISNSTWDWQLMRQALARFLQRVMPPDAWVVRSLPIPKVGRHSVGVGHQFVPELGQSMNSQQAYGVWFATQGLSVPVSWRLVLPDVWVTDKARRRRGEIPNHVGGETLAQCAAAAVLDLMRGNGIERRPVLLDTRSTDIHGAARQFARAGVPYLASVDGAMRLVVADPAVPGYGRGAISARQALESVRALRQPVDYIDPRTRLPQRSLVASIQVMLPDPEPEPSSPRIPRQRTGGRVLRLLGEWLDPQRGPVRMWLTEITTVPNWSLIRTTSLACQVACDLAEIGDRVGLRDFTGRSYQGWHRHMTLASVAHAAYALNRSQLVTA